MDREKLESMREDFPVLRRRRNGKPPVYLDNACTTLVPRQVVDAMTEYYNRYPGCGEGRSQHWFAEDVSHRIEGDPESEMKGSRRLVADFINAESEKEIIFTSNTTHGINMVALGYRFKPGDVVLLGDKEHNSNLLPWLRLQAKELISVDHVESPEGGFDLDAFEQKMEGGGVKLVSIGYTSNLTGFTIPAKEVVKIAHEHGAHVLLDGAQAVPHRAVDVRDLDVDFLAFSIHKMCGPKGVGVLYAKREFIEHRLAADSCLVDPAFIGGGTVGDTTYNSYRLLDPPRELRGGRPKLPGADRGGLGSRVPEEGRHG